MNFIFLPSYNEWKNLPATIKEIKKEIGNKFKYKIVVIDDGSADGTFNNCKKVFPEVDIIKHKKNLGIGGVFRSIILYTMNVENNSNVIIMEADGTSSPSFLPDIIQLLENGIDIVIASRYRKGGGYRNFPFLRLILSKGANILFHSLFPFLKVRDFTIFYRGYKTFCIKNASIKYGKYFITSGGFCSNIEFLIKLVKCNHLKIYEIPFVYDYKKKKGKSKLKIFENLIEYTIFILRIFWFYYFSK